MNRKFLILPLVGLLAFGATSCDDNKGEDIPEEDEDYEVALTDLSDPIEFTDTQDGDKKYQIHEGAPEDGAEYYFGFYQQQQRAMYFFHGGPHSDSKGQYPFYLGCQKETVKNAARIKIEYINDFEFTMQVVAGSGSGNYYDGKYLEFYSEYNSTNSYQTTSLHAVEKSALTRWGHFRFRYTVLDAYVYSPVAWLMNSEAGEVDYEYKGFGTYSSYVSIGTVAQGHLAESSQYIARLWEAKN